MKFGENFLLDHAKSMVTDPKVAMMELIANCSDAGSLQVDVTWPDKVGEKLVIKDNGIGLTYEEFMERWGTLSYQRRKNLGNNVIFPEDVTPKPIRKLFGKTGKGRHSSFCFADSYTISTKKDGLKSSFLVNKSTNPESPFEIKELEKNVESTGHGTTISVDVEKGLIPQDELKEIIGSKFLLDPSFKVLINDEAIEFDDLSDVKAEEVVVDNIGIAKVLFIDSNQKERSSRLRGLVWWVNNRMVSSPSWDNVITKKNHLDGRSRAAKKYGFVIKVDFLDEHVEADWESFQKTEESRLTGEKIDEFIQGKITELLSSARGETKRSVIESNKDIVKDLSEVSQTRLVEFIDKVQSDCPTMKEDDLVHTSRIFAKLEQSRNGFNLLKQLAGCSIDDLDRWTDIISKWDASYAQVILEEVDSRIALINEMERLVHDKQTDELHELQPLFERGLWIFGPQYESIEFQANRTLKTIVENFLAGDKLKLDNAKKRPDLVTSPIGAWESNKYDEEGCVVGADKVLIVELKKGGFDIKQKEMDQARDYAIQLKKAQAIDEFTTVHCYVLGSTLDKYISTTTHEEQNISIFPKSYENVLRQANSRLFNLRKKIKSLSLFEVPREVQEVLSQTEMPLKN